MRGISPIVATVLLIAIVVAIGALLYMGVSQMVEGTSTLGSSSHPLTLDVYLKKEPPGSYQFFSHYYVPVSTHIRWVDAFNYCKERGMFLAMPRNRDQLNRLIGILKEKGWTLAHIGIYRKAGIPKEEAKWYYLTGEVVPDILWAAGQPEISQPEENVGAVGVSPMTEGLHDVNGETNRPFICEGIRIGFLISNLHSSKFLHFSNATLQIYPGGLPEAATSVRVDKRYIIKVDSGGTVYSLDIGALRCSTFHIPPKETATCDVWAIPFNVSYEPGVENLRVCLTGGNIGGKICDTTT